VYGFFVYLRFLSSGYRRSSVTTSNTLSEPGPQAMTAQCQLLYLIGAHKQPRVALDSDAENGTTPQTSDHLLLVKQSAGTEAAGYTTLFREAPHFYQNCGLLLFLRRHWIYGADLVSFFRTLPNFGLLVLCLQLRSRCAKTRPAQAPALRETPQRP
jgi:hypothetical protein